MVTPTSAKIDYPTAKIEQQEKKPQPQVARPAFDQQRHAEGLSKRKVELIEAPSETTQRVEQYTATLKRKDREDDHDAHRQVRDLDLQHQKYSRSYDQSRYDHRRKDREEQGRERHAAFARDSHHSQSARQQQSLSSHYDDSRHIAYAGSTKRQQVSTASVDAFDPRLMRPDFTFTIQSRPDAPYIDYLRRGEKTAECRVNGSMYHRLKEGQILLFHNRNEGIFCKVTFLHRYTTFKEMVEAEGVTNLLPQLKKLNLSSQELISRAVRIYEGFPGSDNVRRFGSIAIGVQYLCDKPKM